jgi:hypothetical protein
VIFPYRIEVNTASVCLIKYYLATITVAALAFVMPTWSQAAEAVDLPQVTHKADVFERLWRAYPNKANKAEAINAWNDLKISDEELDKMRLAYPSWRYSSEWIGHRGKRVPPLATWLNERMWEKEPPPQHPLTLAEGSSFLLQPFYFLPRVAYAITAPIAGGVVYLFDHDKGKQIVGSSVEAPWVWHEFIGDDE